MNTHFSNKFHIKKLTCLALFCMAIVFVSGNVSYADTNSDMISDSKQKISDNKKRMEKIRSEKKEVQSTIDKLNGLKDDVTEYISELDKEISTLDTEITSLESEIDDIKLNIDETRKELEEAKETEKKQYDSMKVRIKYMYENGSMGTLDSLLGSGSFSKMLNKAEYITSVSEYDKKKLDDYILAKEAVISKEEELSSEQAVLKEAKNAAEEKRADTLSLQDEKKAELSSYESKIDSAEADISKLQGSINSLQAAIKAEENAIAAIEAEIRRQEEEARRKAIENGEKYEPLSIGDISFTWPCPASSRITSSFGDREAPVAGASTNHKGIDIGVATGNKAVAAAGGTVVISTYSSSAGNYVMISHGGGIYTVYMHLSKLSVSVGDAVTRGQQIGLTGSTGYSSGPHLHFGIRINGSYVNPLVYVAP